MNDMADMMLFPDTVEEFMEQYKVTDTKHVYTNGTELVPIFRMKQWFEHLQSAQKTGHWIMKEKVRGGLIEDSDYRYECSECGFSDEHNSSREVPFCWHCGAKMGRE